MRRYWGRWAVLVILGALLGLSGATAHAAPRWQVYARITGYSLTGYTYSGTWTTAGRTAACSWDLPLGAAVVVAGDYYVCEDRGLLGYGSPYSWVDIYAPDPWVIPATYGDWQTVAVLP